MEVSSNNALCLPSCRFASAHVGSLPRRIMTACITISTWAGGLPYDLISPISFLFRDSKAWGKGLAERTGPESTQIARRVLPGHRANYDATSPLSPPSPATLRAKKAGPIPTPGTMVPAWLLQGQAKPPLDPSGHCLPVPDT